MRTKKLIALIVITCLVMSISVTAFAADGQEPNAPKDTTGEDVTASTGKAEMTSSNGTAFSTENDDDALAKADDGDGAQINVWAQVRNELTPSYKIDISWGAMKFEFISAGGVWNPETHTMQNPTAENGAWSVNDGALENPFVYLPADDDTTAIANNEIEVGNHSNNAVTAEFALSNLGTVFNDDETGADKVVGNFFASAGAAKTAAETIATTAGVTGDVTENTISLASAEYDQPTDNPDNLPNNTAGNVRKGSVYFAFSGTPDVARGETMYEFKKVGVITVTISDPTKAP